MTPATMTVATETIVKVIPSRPAASDSWKFMPKPNPTTQYWSMCLDTFLLHAGKGLPSVRAIRMPAKSDRAGETKKEPASSSTNSVRVAGIPAARAMTVIFR